MKLRRPYIPIAVRVEVAERQLRNAGYLPLESYRSNGDRLGFALRLLFLGGGERKLELHHRPALLNREVHEYPDGVFSYVPDANDPDFLVYLAKGDHDIETRVRGVGAQLSDLAVARKRKRVERKAKRPKHKWPSRPLKSARRWPKHTRR